MDWLLTKSMYISCKEKAIFIPAEDTTPIDATRNLIKGTINMVNYIFSQEKSFLLVLTKDSEDKKSVLEIPVVCEFPDVFPEISLLSHQKGNLNSILTLFLETYMYRMSPVELGELKIQLEDLLA